MASHGAQAHCCCSGSSISVSGGSAASHGDGGGGYVSPPLPAFVSAEWPALPDSSSIPAVVVPGLELDEHGLKSFPGWMDVRLLAPRAELRLLLVGTSSLIDARRLSSLGEALRALLVMEVRTLKLVSLGAVDSLPRNLPAGSRAVRCQFLTASGVSAGVVLGTPPSVLQHEALVEHALRMTLVTDSVGLQFRLPPPGLSLPAPRSSRLVAGGLPVMDTVAVTSVWAVEVLRSLCKDPRYRTLAALGVAAVGNVADGVFTAADVRRYEVLIAGSWASVAAPQLLPLIATTGSGPAPAAPPAAPGEVLPSPAAAAPPPPPQSCVAAEAGGGGEAAPMDLTMAAANGGAYFGNDALKGYALYGHLQHVGGSGGAGCSAAGGAGAASPDSPDGAAADGPSASGADGTAGLIGNGEPFSRGPGRPTGPLPDKPSDFTGDLPGYVCRRPPLSSCTESQFYDDLVEFLTLLRGKPIDRVRFPEAVLNGVSLDLFGLYREVVTRGGFRVGNGINWKGQVFPRMRNWTETNKQTGVGNALKRHYQNYLWEYELAHPEDVTLDRCVLCNGGDAVSSDWVCCDACENWAHFSCDKRPGIGMFKDYAQGQGRVYPPTSYKEALPTPTIATKNTASSTYDQRPSEDCLATVATTTTPSLSEINRFTPDIDLASEGSTGAREAYYMMLMGLPRR
ncbi:hypothetical protein VOLCADRAFT_121257 [Volvox carteri f. nagariensis]|uniref:ARID domain-containing protein n=1 Tax=Volvox carteri f. nagariensis TaxID=3068 RepID=D8U621_VOLCA|nr:uncharacterized protein VOLCADRAFT_121257 [Volvox carteri f. nagariensis]EFJ44779.1 hypothetical protein VOLCADRAFT_121257 [Volvox carteri f. nagariensis]|eukprot:XP_002954062.1 hypothetical protein VOLCADRAFT_121257 [Volvox carteri f. nagariensis]